MSVLSIASAPSLNFPPELLLRGQGIKVAFFDVDGVLTDGGLYFSEYPDGHERACILDGFRSSGETIKRFNTLDGHGLKLLQKAGITPVVITGRDSSVLRARLQALGITHSHFGTEDKRPAAELTLQACHEPCGVKLRPCQWTPGSQGSGSPCHASFWRPWRSPRIL
jgi:3-deoxy-D-manno-octulosonate 8-phosphate phosphatase (KDO 8-P phosphatase)